MSTKRYPIEPLAEALGVTLGRIGGYQPDAPTEGLAALARSIGASLSTAKRIRKEGLTDAQADRYAVAAGTLPELLWPDWYSQLDQARLTGAAAHNATKTACPAGHPYDVRTTDGRRRCSTCRLSSVVRSRHRQSRTVQCLQENFMSTDRLLTVREVARRWQVSDRTVMRRVAQGQLQAVRIGRTIRFRTEDVEHAEQGAK